MTADADQVIRIGPDVERPVSQTRALDMIGKRCPPLPDPGSDEVDHHKDELRAWLRLLASTTLIENEIRSRFRDQFDFTLPRFDMLAQLDRAPQGMVLGDISRRMMVSAGNVTPICEKLIEDGFVTRTPLPSDRRVQVVRMTRAGRAAFKTMAQMHATWITEFFGDLSAKDLEHLLRILRQLRGSAEQRIAAGRATAADATA